MNDSPTAIAVLRTRLPYVDRRALSEAWFSALHLAAGEEPRVAAAGASGAHEAAPHAAARVPRPQTRGASGVASAAVSRRALDPPSARGTASRARVETAPSRARPALAPSPRSYAAQRSSLTLSVDGSRVQLVLRREGPLLHVVALCRPDAAPLVRRALANADAHLRRTGGSVRASVCVDDRLAVTA